MFGRCRSEARRFCGSEKVEGYRPSDYWDALARHHSALENNYFDLPGVRRIIHDIHEPVLVVGAGYTKRLVIKQINRMKTVLYRVTCNEQALEN